MTRSRTYRLRTLDDMMADDAAKNEWVRYESLEFYVRKGRIFKKNGDASYVKPCLMVANLNTGYRDDVRKDTTSWKIIAFMRKVEAYAVRNGYFGVFVENVYNTRLRKTLKTYCYRRTDSDDRAPSYFISTSTILLKKRQTIMRGMEKLQRPSLSHFFKTPDLTRFWVQDPQENLLLFVRRDRIDPSLPMSRLRMTILEIQRYKIDSRQPHMHHDLYWNHDSTLAETLLRKIEAHIFETEFDELAISATAIWIGARGWAAVGRDIDTDRLFAEHQLLQLGYSKIAGARGRGMARHVKPILFKPGDDR